MRRLVALPLAVALAGCGGGTPAPTPPKPDKPAPSASASAAPAPFACPATAPSAPLGDAEGFEGAAIVAVCVAPASASARLSPEGRAAAERAVVLRAGRPLAAAQVAEDLSALARLRRFAETAAVAERRDGGVVLHYALAERPIVADVAITGSTGPRPAKPPLAKGAPIDPAEVAAVARALADECRSRGYGACVASSKVAETSPGAVTVTFEVVEGAPWTWSRLVFKGTKRIGDKELAAASGLVIGKPIVEAEVPLAEMKIAARYYDAGMVQARVKSGDVAVKDGAGTVTFTIEEGPVFTVGAIKLGKLGAGHDKEVLPKLATRPGKTFSRSVLVTDLQAVKAWFAAKGQSVEVVPILDLDAKKSAVSLTLDVEPP